MKPSYRLTTNQGVPVSDNQNSKTAGQQGPTLLEDYHLINWPILTVNVFLTPNHYWDFMSHTPESTHMITWLFSDLGIPRNYRTMEGFGVHAFKWVNKEGKVTYIKYHWKPLQGVHSLTSEQAKAVAAEDFNHATRDLYESIENGDFPSWDLYVQMLEPERLDDFSFDPLDPTKVWPEEDLPLIKVGCMTLNENPVNYFAEVEQSAFSPSATVPGIEPSEDKLLQGRLFSYPDTQRHRLGPNYLQIPVNCPFAKVHNYQRDGQMTVHANPSPINYEPNSYEEAPKEAEAAFEDSKAPLKGTIVRQAIDKKDPFTQAGERYENYTPEVRNRLVQNLVEDMKSVDPAIQLRVIYNFFRAHPEFGSRVAEGLGISLDEYLPRQ